MSKKLSESEINSKILSTSKKIEKNAEIIKKFINDMEPNLSPDLRKAILEIKKQYNRLNKYDVAPDSVKNFRKSNAETLINSGSIDDLTSILSQLCYGILDLNGTQIIEDDLYLLIGTIMLILINSCDGSATFGSEVCKRDNLLNLYHRILSNCQEACTKGTLHETFAQILESIIWTLYNTMLYDSGENLQKMQNMKYLDIIKNFLNCNYSGVKMSSLLFVAYVVNESDSALFKSDQTSIKCLLNLLFESIQVKAGAAQGLSLCELARGIEKLSKNDVNKQLLVDLGVLPIIKRLIKKDSCKYKKIGLSILWSLAFDERNRKMINESFSSILSEMKDSTSKTNQPNVVQKMVKECVPIDSSSNDNEKTDVNRKMAPAKRMMDPMIVDKTGQKVPSGATDADPDTLKFFQTLDGLLWTLKESESKEKKVESSGEPSLTASSLKEGHIMISYCWSNSEIVMNMYNVLKGLGYKLWIDKYNMSQKANLMESMANGIENSVALLICVSSAYKESDNCRAEAQYAATKKKSIIPVMVQHKYRPDGWLGFCISGLLYIDFKGSRSFDVSMKELSTYLQRISTSTQPDVDVVDHIEKVNAIPITKSAVNWSHSQVMEWFIEIGLQKINWKSHYNGQELSFLQTLSNSSTETFFQICVNELGLTDLRDFRIFYENIQKYQLNDK